MIYVMSDLHGMYEKYKEMLACIHFSDEDVLYVIGDIVDRGNDAMKILEDMMHRPNVFAIIGNHELMMADCITWMIQEVTDEFLDRLPEDKLIRLSNWMQNGGLATIKEYKRLNIKKQRAIIDYIMEFTAYEEISVKDKEFLLVHAGLGNFHAEKALEDYEIEELVWDRPDWNIPYFTQANKFVVVGHTPTLEITGKASILHKNNYIVIDCGACFENGALACLCLDTMEEFYV